MVFLSLYHLVLYYIKKCIDLDELRFSKCLALYNPILIDV